MPGVVPVLHREAERGKATLGRRVLQRTHQAPPDPPASHVRPHPEGQLGDAVGSGPLRATIREAITSLRRGVVAAAYDEDD